MVGDPAKETAKDPTGRRTMRNQSSESPWRKEYAKSEDYQQCQIVQRGHKRRELRKVH